MSLFVSVRFAMKIRPRQHEFLPLVFHDPHRPYDLTVFELPRFEQARRLFHAADGDLRKAAGLDRMYVRRRVIVR